MITVIVLCYTIHHQSTDTKRATLTYTSVTFIVFPISSFRLPVYFLRPSRTQEQNISAFRTFLTLPTTHRVHFTVKTTSDSIVCKRRGNSDIAPTLTGRRVFFEFQNDRGSGDLLMKGLGLHRGHDVRGSSSSECGVVAVRRNGCEFKVSLRRGFTAVVHKRHSDVDQLTKMLLHGRRMCYVTLYTRTHTHTQHTVALAVGTTVAVVSL